MCQQLTAARHTTNQSTMNQETATIQWVPASEAERQALNTACTLKADLNGHTIYKTADGTGYRINCQRTIELYPTLDSALREIARQQENLAISAAYAAKEAEDAQTLKRVFDFIAQHARTNDRKTIGKIAADLGATQEGNLHPNYVCSPFAVFTDLHNLKGGISLVPYKKGAWALTDGEVKFSRFVTTKKMVAQCLYNWLHHEYQKGTPGITVSNYMRDAGPNPAYWWPVKPLEETLF